MHNPCIDHWNVVIYILRYLQKPSGQRVLYEDKGNTQICGYCDVDWTDSLMDKRSTTRYCVLLGENIISWKSNKKNVDKAMASLTCELIWVSNSSKN